MLYFTLIIELLQAQNTYNLLTVTRDMPDHEHIHLPSSTYPKTPLPFLFNPTLQDTLNYIELWLPMKISLFFKLYPSRTIHIQLPWH